jgi:6,7-dimethyl-8-ribityllumazine synthase
MLKHEHTASYLDFPHAALVRGVRILIVEARFYPELADALLAGATNMLHHYGVEFDVYTVDGALEIPCCIAALSSSYAAAVALGCVIRGETSHYDLVAGESARALMDLSLTHRKAGGALPIGNGILTVENEAQAWARADPDQMNKGGGAARAVLRVLALQKYAQAL